MKCPSVCALPRGSHIGLNWPSQARWLQTVFCMRATHPQRTKFPSVGPSGSYGFTVELAAGSAPPAKASCHGLARTPVKNYTSSSRDPPGMTPGPRESILAVWRAPRGSGERTEDPETRSSTMWTKKSPQHTKWSRDAVPRALWWSDAGAAACARFRARASEPHPRVSPLFDAHRCHSERCAHHPAVHRT